MISWLLLGSLVAASPEAEARPRGPSIAVLDVQYAGLGDRKTVEGLSALLASEVARRPNLAVVAGADLRALLGFERQKQLLGCAEGSCVAELAGALGVTYLLASEVSRVGSTWLVSLTLLDARKGMPVRRLTRRADSDDLLVDEATRAVDELLSGLPGVAPPASSTRFDGSWNVTIECPSSPEPGGPKGYRVRFKATVKDGQLVGSLGVASRAAWVRLEGLVPPDGKARLVATGRTGSPRYDVHHAPEGTPYSYHVDAVFEGARGTGKRVEERACTFGFLKE